MIKIIFIKPSTGSVQVFAANDKTAIAYAESMGYRKFAQGENLEVFHSVIPNIDGKGKTDTITT